MTHNTTSALKTMTRGTFNFLCDTLFEEIQMHPHREELIKLMQQQWEDDA
jgi:hypothetical protein